LEKCAVSLAHPEQDEEELHHMQEVHGWLRQALTEAGFTGPEQEAEIEDSHEEEEEEGSEDEKDSEGEEESEDEDDGDGYDGESCDSEEELLDDGEMMSFDEDSDLSDFSDLEM
jgi:hypothetical protein